MKSILFTLLLLTSSLLNVKAGEKSSPEELGTVKWLRSYPLAIKKAKQENKQILILFQEVPGCSTCRNYGRNVLSNPLMVEAIEQYFVPLAIYNNKGDEDAVILAMFNEPSWNNPVVRIINPEGRNEVPRLAANYSALGLYESMQTALQKKQIVPEEYFNLLGEELEAEKAGSIEEVYFKMYCFWSGEGHLGKKDGVLATEPGFMGGHEVVKVKYDTRKIKQDELKKYAEQASCSSIPAADNYRIDKDPQYYLKKSIYRYLPLSPIQRTKINSAIANGTDPSYYLSPTQLKWLHAIKQENGSKETLYEKLFEDAWMIKSENTDL